jgi:hypothetical protein
MSMHLSSSVVSVKDGDVRDLLTFWPVVRIHGSIIHEHLSPPLSCTVSRHAKDNVTLRLGSGPMPLT